jgi:hypothetical protein
MHLTFINCMNYFPIRSSQISTKSLPDIKFDRLNLNRIVTKTTIKTVLIQTDKAPPHIETELALVMTLFKDHFT